VGVIDGNLVWFQVITVTIRIDVDDDGKTDAKVPLKWVLIVGGVLLAACPLTRGLV